MKIVNSEQRKDNPATSYKITAKTEIYTKTKLIKDESTRQNEQTQQLEVRQ